MVVLIAYLVYFSVSVALTLVCGYFMFKRGRVFLLDVFGGKEALADSVNHLLLMGFYLVNVGIISISTKVAIQPTDAVEAVEIVTTKVGYIMLILGSLHFLNLIFLSKTRSERKALGM